jgi:hypothetical protein
MRLGRLRFWLLGTAIALLPTLVAAQQIEVTPFAGFGSVEIADGLDDDHHDSHYHHHGSERSVDHLAIDDEPSFGLIVGLGVTRHTQIELLYDRLDTTTVESHFGPRARGMDLEYLHVGAIYQWTFDRVEPFLGGSLGATRISLPGGNDEAFSLSATGGVKLLFNDRVGIRFSGRLFLTEIEESGAILCPLGECLGHSGEEVLAHLEIGSGLLIRFGE